ncbi:probable ATP-dependent DNA helicase HFM1 [Antedon mediterranea]|uniref:probable ATP-dependent DNA helicase HFM1 n=1 Tax=Antedon mediterranea TaxID=105859 RepID=UPI003AF47285
MFQPAEKYRNIFPFPYFNAVQSAVMNDALYTDKSLVVSAPTGSGKTAVFELAIVRLLSFGNISSFKIVYMAPMKALCSERCQDWQEKFSALNIKCSELTGDTEEEECQQLHNSSIILTTPEKWDSMSRKWRDNKSLFKLVKLFLIDEVHSVNDDTRGPTVEAVISRMKTVKLTTGVTSDEDPKLRFVAVSATMPNIEDLSEWIGDAKSPAIYHKFDDAYRPVPLRKYVHGFYYNEKSSPYKFDLSLNYQLSKMITRYSNQKPTLVFCSTRKGTQIAADVLAKDSYRWNFKTRPILQTEATHLKDAKLRDLVCKGVAYHHAGMHRDDRDKIQNMFIQGNLPALMATSTLAFGVNLPAHLVIIKSTQHYVSGQYKEYSESQVIQMMGRAGRPQFDTSASVVIMTKNQTKAKYESLTAGEKYLESSLHTRLIEHLNAEIVLHTINDISIALEWLKSTLLYVRIRKNPTHYGIVQATASQDDIEKHLMGKLQYTHYGIQATASHDDIEKHLMGICVSDLNRLSGIGAINMDDEGFDVKPTDIGQLMARYCISFDTMKTFCNIKGDVDLEEMVNILSSCHEFDDIKLRMNERRLLNSLNKDANHITVRFPIAGKIKSTQLKVNCLIQATLGCLPVQEFALQQDVLKIFRVGARVSRCLYEMMQQTGNYKSLLNAAFLAKCFKAKLWENSRYVSRQIERIGPTLSTALVNANIGSFNKLLDTNPRQIELIVNRHPPFGNQIHDAVSRLPIYKVEVSQSDKHASSSAEITVTICLENRETLQQASNSYHCSLLLIGNADDEIIIKKKIMDSTLINSIVWSRTLTLQRAKSGDDITIHYISQEYVGLDVQQTLTLEYLKTRYSTHFTQGSQQPTLKTFMKQSKPVRFTAATPKPRSPESAEDIEWSPSTQGKMCLSYNKLHCKVTAKLKKKHILYLFAIFLFGTTPEGRKACSHKCANKGSCGHLCCRIGVAIKPASRSKAAKRQLDMMSGTTPLKQKSMTLFLNQLHARAKCMPQIQRRRETQDIPPHTFSMNQEQLDDTRKTLMNQEQLDDTRKTLMNQEQLDDTRKTLMNQEQLDDTPKTLNKFRFKSKKCKMTSIYTEQINSSSALVSVDEIIDLPPSDCCQSRTQSSSNSTNSFNTMPRYSAKSPDRATPRDTADLHTAEQGNTLAKSRVQTKKRANTAMFGTRPAKTPSACPATPARGWEHLDVYHKNRSKIIQDQHFLGESSDDDPFVLPEVNDINGPTIFPPGYKPFNAQTIRLDRKEQLSSSSMPAEYPDSFIASSSGQLVPCRKFTNMPTYSDTWPFNRQVEKNHTIPQEPSMLNMDMSFSEEEFYPSEGSCDINDFKENEALNVNQSMDTNKQNAPIVLIIDNDDEDVYYFKESEQDAPICEKPDEKYTTDTRYGNFSNDEVGMVNGVTSSQLSDDYDFNYQESKVVQEVPQLENLSNQHIPNQSFFGTNNSVSMNDDGTDNMFNSIFDGIF